MTLDFKAFICSKTGESDSDCKSYNINSSCVVSKCRQHSAFLADAFSPSVHCTYHRGSCKYQVFKSETENWPVSQVGSCLISFCWIALVPDLGRKQLAIGNWAINIRCRKRRVWNMGATPFARIPPWSLIILRKLNVKQVLVSGAVLTLATFVLTEYLNHALSRLKQR
jgi:hypothetical protein